MDFTARIELIGFDGAPASVALDLEAYSLLDNKWHTLADLLKLSRVTPKLTNENGRYTIAFSLKNPGPTVLFATIATFRMVVRPTRDGSAASVIVAPVQIITDGARLDLDFGTALFLADRGFAVTGGDAPVFGAAIALASQDATIAAAQRAFYAQTGAIATAIKQLADCQANVARLTRDNAALTKRADTATADLQACATERASLADQLKAAVADATAKAKALTAAQTDAGAARTQLEAAQTELRTMAQARTDAEAKLAECRTGAAKLTRDLAALTRKADAAAAALQSCTAERATLADQLKAATDEAAAKSHALDAAQTDANAVRMQLETVQSDLRAATQARDQATDQLVAAQHLLESRDAELAQLREAAGDTAVIHRIRDQLTTETARAAAAETQLAAVREQHRVAAPAGDIVSNFVMSLGQVNRTLADGAIPYRLGRTDVLLKAFVGGAGDLVSLVDAGHSIRDPAVSEVRFELTPDDPVAAPATGGLIVPELLGLTETAVIRVLSSQFLKAEKAVATVAAGSEKHGRALRQLPAAGASVARGSTVLVVYGAAEGA
jgi:predicted  nucleic acid-binding Zn-ribbon protein